ncbi:MAG: hypothetical protein ACLFU1_03390 [Alphaproteobacteria bacterium]
MLDTRKKYNTTAQPYTATTPQELTSLLKRFKDTYGKKGVAILTTIITSHRLNHGEKTTDPKHGCYAGTEYSLPLGIYFMRTSLLDTPLNPTRQQNESLYTQMCTDIDAYRKEKNKPTAYSLYPPRQLIEELCAKGIKQLTPLQPPQKLSNPNIQ